VECAAALRNRFGSRVQIMALSPLCGVLFPTLLDNRIACVGLAHIQCSFSASVTPLQWW